MSTYLEMAKNTFEHSQGDVSGDYSRILKETAMFFATIAIAEQLQRLNQKLDELTNGAGNAIQTEVFGH